jgi:hypothetical protein
VIVVVTCEKEEQVAFGMVLFKHKVTLRPAEREERKQIVEFLLS